MMSDETKDKSGHGTRPAQPQPTWPPAMAPGHIAGMDISQWQHQMWPWAAMTGINPAYHQQMSMYMQQVAANAAATPPQASTTAKDDAVKVVKPKESQARGIHSPAGIQSPKPNSPGFLLGAGKGGGCRAFSPYTSRAETPGAPMTVPGDAGAPTTGFVRLPQPPPFDYYIVNEYENVTAAAAVGSSVSNGVDLTKTTKKSKSKKSADKDKDKGGRPVGVAFGRQRSPDSMKTETSITTTSSSTPTTSSSSSGTTAAVTSSSAAVSTTMSGAWSPYMSYPMANPYQHFAIAAAQPAMYMVPAARPIFAAGQAAGPPHPGYLQMAPPQQMMLSELTVKTCQQQGVAHASTSPSKPLSSAASSPKSPLDKAREKLNEINQRKGSSQPSPSSSELEAKSICSDTTDKAAESEKAHQTSVIMANHQALPVPEPPPPGPLKPPPTKRERKNRASSGNKGGGKTSQDKGTPPKVRRKASSTDVLPLPAAETDAITDSLPLKSKPLIAPAKFKPETSTLIPFDLASPPSQFTKPANKRSAPAEKQVRQRRSRSKESVDSVNNKPAVFEPLPVSRRSNSTGSDNIPKTIQPLNEAAAGNIVKPGSPPTSIMEIVKDIKPIVSNKPTTTKASPNVKQTLPKSLNTKLATFNTSTKSTTSKSPRINPLSTTFPHTQAALSRLANPKSAMAKPADVKVKPILPKPVNTKPATTRVRQGVASRAKRKSAEISGSGEAQVNPDILVQTQTSLVQEKKDFEDEPIPIIVKHNQQAYDLCQDDDLKTLETKLKSRLKLVRKQIHNHQSFLSGETSALTLMRCRSLAGTDNRDTPLSPDKQKSGFSVRSDSHPSMKMKAAAKAKSRASQSDEMETESPTRPSKAKKSMAPLTPITIPEQRIECRKLTKQELLTVDGLILTSIDGLFYESRIRPIDPPDLFGVLIDGERHSKPRIFTEEELCNNTFSNLTPMYLTQLSIGTRVCAYWSDMIGCLYPGKVTALYPSAGTNSKHLIDIEFDDGDSGKFPLYQIRLLPHDYPHVDYDTSNVLPVGRRRRSTVPETPPIMTTPPSNRSRLNQSSLPRKSSQYAATSKKKGRRASHSTSVSSPPVVESELEVFDQSTDDERLEEEGTPHCRWEWAGPSTKKMARGRGSKEYYQAIMRDNSETIKVGDCAVFKSVGSMTLPYIGEIQNMWEGWGGKMIVNVKWFYHPEELEEEGVSLPKHKGALFRSEHIDENDIQTIRHKCEVVSYEEYLKRKLHLRSGEDRMKYASFYLAGNYDAARRKIICVYV